MSNKTRIVSFRVSDGEYQQIKKLADNSYRSISNWLRKKIIRDKGEKNVK